MIDREDMERARLAVCRVAEIKIGELAKLALPPGTRDWRIVRDLRRADPATLSDDDLDEIGRLMWKHRRRLPRHLSPRMNPDDPVVREMEDVDG